MTSADTRTSSAPSPQAGLPCSHMLWLTGDAALAFALGWAASAHGGRTAALVLTAIALPRTAATPFRALPVAPVPDV